MEGARQGVIGMRVVGCSGDGENNELTTGLVVTVERSQRNVADLFISHSGSTHVVFQSCHRLPLSCMHGMLLNSTT